MSGCSIIPYESKLSSSTLFQINKTIQRETNKLIEPYYKKILVRYFRKGNFLYVYETLTLSPHGKNFSVMYRSFSDKIFIKNSLCNIQILNISCSQGLPYFAEEYAEPVDINMNKAYSVSDYLKSKVHSNEVGCLFNSSAHSVYKDETLNITYVVPYSYVINSNCTHAFFSYKYPSVKDFEA